MYTIEKAQLLTNQLNKFKDSYAYMVAGQFANLDFWINEVENCLKAIDEHNLRFEKMQNAQEFWINEKNVLIPNYCFICNGICELSDNHYKKPELPKNKDSKRKNETRVALVNATYYFLMRCFKLELLSIKLLKDYCDKIGTSIDENDFK